MQNNENIRSSTFSYDINSKNNSISDNGQVIDQDNSYKYYSNVEIRKSYDNKSNYIGNFVSNVDPKKLLEGMKKKDSQWKQIIDNFEKYSGDFYIYKNENGELCIRSKQVSNGLPVWSYTGEMFRRQLTILNIYQYILSGNMIMFYYEQVDEIEKVEEFGFENLQEQKSEELFFKSSKNISNLIDNLFDYFVQGKVVFNMDRDIWRQLYGSIQNNELYEVIGLSIIINVITLSRQRYEYINGDEALMAIYIPRVKKQSAGIDVYSQIKDPGENRILLPLKIDQSSQIFYNTDYFDLFDMDNILSIKRKNQPDGNIFYNNVWQYMQYGEYGDIDINNNGVHMQKVNDMVDDDSNQVARFKKYQDFQDELKAQVQSQDYFNELNVNMSAIDAMQKSLGITVTQFSPIQGVTWIAKSLISSLSAFTLSIFTVITVVQTFAISSISKYQAQRRDQMYCVDQGKLINIYFDNMSAYSAMDNSRSVIVGLNDFIDQGRNIYNLQDDNGRFDINKEYLPKFYLFSEDKNDNVVIIYDDYGALFGMEDKEGNINIFGQLHLIKSYSKESNNFVYQLQKVQLSQPISAGKFQDMQRSIVKDIYDKQIQSDDQINQLINAELFILSSANELSLRSPIYVYSNMNIQDEYEQYRHQQLDDIKQTDIRRTSNYDSIPNNDKYFIVPLPTQENVSQLEVQSKSLSTNLNSKNLLTRFDDDTLSSIFGQLRDERIYNVVNADIVLDSIEINTNIDQYVFYKYTEDHYKLLGLQHGNY